MYKAKTVSVIFGTYREKKSIRKAIDDIFSTGFVDEVVVVNNNAEKGTDTEIKKTKAKLYYEKRQGYGWAYQAAMANATGDYIITTEVDGTFDAKDIERLLVYAEDYEIVQGSRTSLIGSLEGINGMNLTRKWMNVFVAKTIEFLFNTNALTDVGCTFRLIKRKTYNKLKKYWVKKDALFNTEVLVSAIANKVSFVEIPVSYRKRVGKSQILGSFMKEAQWAIKIQIYIFYSWLRFIIKKIYGK